MAIVIDFETYYDREYSLTKMTTEQYIRDPRFEVIGVCVKEDDGPTRWITGESHIIKAELEKYRMEEKTVAAHNMAFDGAILSWVFGIKPKFLVDTLSMARPFTGLTVGGSLRALAHEYGLGEKGTEIYNTIGKHRLDFTPEELERFGEYCFQDVELTYKLLHVLYPKTRQEEMFLIDMTLRMFIEPQIVLDKEILQERLKVVREQKAELLSKVVADKKDLMSNPKFAELLRAREVEPPMKISPATGKETYAFSKTDVAFKELLNHPDYVVQALVAARLGCKSTLEETRTEALIGVAERGPWPIMLRYYGAATGRFSGADGCNPQNLPRGGAIRQAMKAPKGHKIVACDSSNIEGRVNAWFSGQEDMLELFRKGEDLYCDFASKVFGRTITKKDKSERFVGKTCILGLGYGTGWRKLQQTLKIGAGIDYDDAEAQRIVNVYRATYYSIRAMWRKCAQALDVMLAGGSGVLGEACPLRFEQQKIWLPSGRFLYYPELRVNENGEIEYRRVRLFARIYGAKVLENITQSLARDIVLYQTLEIAKYLRKKGGNKDGKVRQVVLSVHDEAVVIVPEEEAEDTLKFMEAAMRKSPDWARDLPLNCEGSLGNSYADAK